MPKNGGVVMVNFYSGFIVPEAARLRKQMFETVRELKKKYPGREGVPGRDRRSGGRTTRSRGGRSTTSSITSTTSSRSPGIDHVGIGSDFDGIDSAPEQLDDVSKYPLITQELLNRGYTKEQILKVLGGNFMRVFRAAEQAAGRSDQHHNQWSRGRAITASRAASAAG